MFRLLKSIGEDTSGATAVEYGLILALIFLAIVGAVQSFGNETIVMWTTVAGKMATAGAGGG